MPISSAWLRGARSTRTTIEWPRYGNTAPSAKLTSGTCRPLHSSILRAIQRSLSRTKPSMRDTGMVAGALTVSPFSSTLRPTPRRPRRRTSTYCNGDSPSIMRCRSRETSSRVAIGGPRDVHHLALDPAFHRVLHLQHVHPLRVDRRPDHHANGTCMLAKCIARPDLAGVVRDGHDRQPRTRGEECPAHAIAP